MEQNEFIIELLARLNEEKSKKQIDANIKQLEKVIKKIELICTFTKGDTKKELNAYITQLNEQLNHIKLQAKLDNKKLQRQINESLKNISFSGIDINIDEGKMKMKVQKAVAEAKAVIEKNPLPFNIETRKEKLNNQLTSYLNKNSKIKESSLLLEEADKLRKTFSSIGDRNTAKDATEQFQLFKSEVVATGFAGQSTTDKIKNMVGHITKIGTAFGVASTAINQFSQSQKNLREIDTILTEISKTSEMTKNQLIELGDASFDAANKYGQLAKNYLLGVQEMARSGYEEKATELGELSSIAQSAGDMTAEMANNYILATDAAYKYSGSIEKLTSALDGANYVSNKNSASLTDIADGIRVSASYAANAGVEIDQLTAAEATMIATTKRSGSEIGRAFRSILLNLQQVAGEFDGEVIDEESLKKVENRCHSLGVELETLKDGVATLRNPMEVLKELSEVYNSLPDSSADKQGLISDIGGKYHANSLTALLSRWDLYEKMLQEYSQGTGSALDEAIKTANSWEGKLSQLQNTWDGFVNSITNKEAVKGGISFLDGTIQSFEKLTDIMGTIPTMLTAINGSVSALNKDYGITQLFNQDTHKMDIQGSFMGINFTEIKAQKKHFNEAATAIGKWNAELASGQTDLNDFGESIVKNSVQFKSYLETCSKDAPASLAGYKSYLNAAGVSTDALRLKTILLTSAMSLGIGLAVQSVVGGITKLVQAQEEIRQRAQKLGSEFKSTESDISSYKNKINDLYQTINNSSSIEDVTAARKNLLIVQDELISKFGNEKEIIDMVTDAINGQTEAFDRLTQKQWQEKLNEFNDGDFSNNTSNFLNGYKNNIDRMLSEYGDYTARIDIGWAVGNWKSNEAKEIVKQLETAGAKISHSISGNDASVPIIELNGTANEVYDKLLGIQNLFSSDNPLSTDTFREKLTKLANDAKDISSQYEDMYNYYVLYEKIFANRSYTELFNSINTAYKDYQNAFASGNEESIDKAIENFSSILTAATDGLTDESIIDYFNNMYPSLKSAVDQWEFKTKIIPEFDTSDFKGKTQNDILTMLETDGAQDGKELFTSILEKAKEYNLITDNSAESIQKVLDLLVEWGILQGETSPKADVSGKTPIFSLTEGTQQSISDFQSNLSSLSDALTKVRKSELTAAEKTGLFTKFKSLIGQSDNLEKAITDLMEQSLKELLETLGSDIPEDLFESLTQSVAEAKSELESISNYADKLAQLSDGFGKMASAYNEFKEGGFSDISTMDGMEESFGNLDSYKEFISTAGNAKSTATEIQDAFDKLAGEYIAHSGILDDLNDKNRETIVTQLEAMGVTNARTIVEQELARAEQERALQEQFLTLTGNDLINTTYAEINALVEAGKISRQTAGQLEVLALKKQWVNRNVITTSGDIKNMAQLATAGSKLSKMLTALASAKKTVENNPSVAPHYQSIIDGMEKEIDAMINGEWGNNANIDTTYRAPSTTSGSTKSAKDSAESFAESIDWAAQSVSNLNRELDRLNEVLEHDKSWEAKISTQGKIIKQQETIADRYKKMADAYKKYYEKTSKGVSSAYKNKIKNGDTFTIEDFKGKGGKSAYEKVKEAQEAYNQWQDAQLDALKEKGKLQDAQNARLQLYIDKYTELEEKYNAQIEIKTGRKKLELYNDLLKAQRKEYSYQLKLAKTEHERIRLQAELAKIVAQNKLSKFQSRQQDYEDVISLNQSKQEIMNANIGLLETMGKQTGTAYYTELIRLEENQQKKLQQQQKELQKAMDDAVKGGFVQYGSAEWKEMADSIYGVSKAILDSKNKLFEFENSIRQLKWDNFDNLIDKLGTVVSESDFLIDLMSNSKLTQDSGGYTAEGLATQGQHGINYNTYLQQAEEYAKELAALDMNSTDSAVIERIRELTEARQQAILSAMSEKQAMIDLAKEGIQAEIDAYSELTEKKKEALDAEKELRDYQKSITDKKNTISQLQKAINALEGDDSDENKKRLRELKAKLAEAQQDLTDTEYDHSIDAQKEALDKSLEEFTESRNEYMDDTEKVFNDTLNAVNSNTQAIAGTITSIAGKVGYTISNTITNAWKSGTSAVSDYAGTFRSASAGILSQLNNIRDAWVKVAEEAEKAAKSQVKAIQSDNASVTDAKQETGKVTNNGTPVSGIISTESEKQVGLEKAVQIDQLLKNATGKGGTSALNKYVHSNYGTYLGNTDMVKLASLLGVKGVTSKSITGNDSQKNAIYKALKKAGFSRGGIIEEDNGILSAMKKAMKENGDDTIITAHTGESVLTEKQTKALADKEKNDDIYTFGERDENGKLKPMCVQGKEYDMMDFESPLNMKNSYLPDGRNMYDVYSNMMGEAGKQLNAEVFSRMKQPETTVTNAPTYNGDVIIHLDGSKVVDAESFRKEILTDSQTQRALRHIVLDKAMGNGSLNYTKYI